MKLSAWAKTQGITYGTALRWFHENKLPVKAEKVKSGAILVHSEPIVNENKTVAIIFNGGFDELLRKLNA